MTSRRPSPGRGRERGELIMEITFLGATGTVTGSKYLVSAGGRKILVDCGLFQGYKQLRLRNRAPLPVNPREIDAVILTHAHLDHSGYLPLLIKNGYAGKVYCTQATRDLCAILLPDSGHLQEEEAEYANRHKFSRHTPALPLYTREDAERSLTRFAPVDFARDVDLGGGLALHLLPAGHMLGSSFVRLRYEGKTLLFTGDLGRPNDLIMVAPTVVDRADYLVVESTYGDRRHDPADPRQRLAEGVNRTAARGGAGGGAGGARRRGDRAGVRRGARAVADVPHPSAQGGARHSRSPGVSQQPDGGECHAH